MLNENQENQEYSSVSLLRVLKDKLKAAKIMEICCEDTSFDIVELGTILYIVTLLRFRRTLQNSFFNVI